MKTFNFSIILLMLLSFCCNHNEKNTIISKNNNSINQTDTLYYANDTLLFVSYISENAILLHWGIENSFINTSLDTLLYNSGFNSLVKKNNYFIIYDGCGTGCNYAFIAEIKPNQVGKLFLYPLAEDFSRNLFCFQGGGENLAVIENLNNGLSIKINEDFDHTNRPYSLSIDTCFFVEKSLFIKWKSSKGKLISKEFDISSIL